MISIWGWFALGGPLILAGAAGGLKLEQDPSLRARLALGAALFALAIAVAIGFAVFAVGPTQTGLIGAGGVGVSLKLDQLSVVMLVLVAFVGAVVINFSRNYLDGDPRQGVFFERLCRAITSVTVLVCAGNLALFIAAWVATSLSVNKLLLFCPERQAAVLAARKKFVVNRLGDLSLISAAALLYSQFHTLEIGDLIARVAGADAAAMTAPALLIVAAGILKSAQFPLHGWILEVMETPTPVSALLHAGIVNAGGFLIIRLSEIVIAAPGAMHALAIVGGFTAIFGSLVMLTQTSVKVSLAYSTVAQMGFMMLQCGLGAFAAALLHIVAHSLYKAHAFLSSGSVIDLLRASWSPSPGGAPHPARFVFALLSALGVAALCGAWLGASLTDKPGAFALASILLMGLTLLVSNAVDQCLTASVIARAGLAAAGVAVLYFALHAGTELLLGDAVAQTQALSEPIGAAILWTVVASFGLVTWAQSQLGAISATAWGRAAYVHLSHGLYVNTLLNRWALRFWPVPSTSSLSNA